MVPWFSLFGGILTRRSTFSNDNFYGQCCFRAKILMTKNFSTCSNTLNTLNTHPMRLVSISMHKRKAPAIQSNEDSL